MVAMEGVMNVWARRGRVGLQVAAILRVVGKGVRGGEFVVWWFLIPGVVFWTYLYFDLRNSGLKLCGSGQEGEQENHGQVLYMYIYMASKAFKGCPQTSHSW